jgi:hypothetical protein
VASPAFAQSHDPSIGSGNIDRSAMTAPVGHRQPRARDVPPTNIGNNPSAYARDPKLERALRSICRGNSGRLCATLMARGRELGHILIDEVTRRPVCL